jgi:hypothetical protein
MNPKCGATAKIADIDLDILEQMIVNYLQKQCDEKGGTF